MKLSYTILLIIFLSLGALKVPGDAALFLTILFRVLFMRKEEEIRTIIIKHEKE